MQNHKPVVHIVDDEALIREALAELVQSVGFAARTHASAEAFLAAEKPDTPSCAIIDVCMPGMSGLMLQKQLQGSRQGMPVIMLSGHADVPMAVEAMTTGAIGFVEKPYRQHELLELVKRAIDRDRLHRQQEARRRELQARFEQLTPRERQVFDLVVAGELNKVIAGRLNISQRTVELHRSHVMEKLRANSVAELVKLAYQLRAPS